MYCSFGILGAWPKNSISAAISAVTYFFYFNLLKYSINPFSFQSDIQFHWIYFLVLSNFYHTTRKKQPLTNISQRHPFKPAFFHTLFNEIYHIHIPFYIVTTACTVDLLIPYFFAAWRTVALLSMIYRAISIARSSI